VKWQAGNDNEMMMKDENKEDDVDDWLESDLPTSTKSSMVGPGRGSARGYTFRR
jgi:hypothetical protein